jgi:thiol-disulfide isomerase/thioredoxin
MTTIEPLRLTLDVTGLATRVATSHEAVEPVVGRGPTSVAHDQRLTLLDTRLVAELGVVHDVAVGAMLPWRAVRAGIRYLDASGQAVALETPSIHHRDETLSGLGDPWLWIRYGRGFGRFTVGVRAGVTVPLGRTEEDPFELGARGLDHQHVQLGTGTWDPIVGLEASHAWKSVSLYAWVVTQQVLYENRRGYRAGNRYAGALMARSALGTETIEAHAGLEVQVEAAERWRGLVPTDDGNQGRESWSVNLQAKIPAYVWVKNAQLSYPVVGLVGVAGVFDFGDGHDHAHEGEGEDDHGEGHGPGDDHDHGHGHGPDAGVDDGLDVAAIAARGEAVDLVPVPGKVTVFDFWATWCKPCAELDRLLAALGRRHPGAIAVRKIDVVDDESPAWKRHLAPAGHILPHVKVYGRDGRLVLERSGDPHALAEEIERVVRAAPR